MKNKLRKTLSLLLISLLMLLYVVYPVVSFAQEVTPTDTPAADQTTVDNSATASNNSDTSSNTGGNAINPTDTPTPTTDPSLTPTDTPTPTPDPSLTPTDTPTPTITDSGTTTAQNSAQVDNSATSSANTGENTIDASSSAQDSATPSADTTSDNSNSDNNSGGGSVNTGSAVSTTNLENDVNATNVNSKVIYQTINIFVDQNGDLNLSDPFNVAANEIQSHPDDSVINVGFTNINNYALLANNVVSFANSGNNSVNGSSGGQQAVINTGDAYSLVSLLNNVNFTIIGSDLHIVTINIFGNLNGNIILPDLNSNQSNNCGCGVSVVANNNATVTNNISSSANSGENSITSGSGTIDTGNAQSVVDNLNIVNTNLIGVSAAALYINVLGSWNGDFIGWDGFNPQTGGANLVFYNLGPNLGGTGADCGSCDNNININNTANVTNNISSTANTGGNSINGNGSITTGNAFSAISLINLINTNFINSFGFFGFINIFANWTGNIGGQSQFDALSQNASSDNSGNSSSSDQVSSSADVQESGGNLTLTQTNNVGAYVLPGDTVTFFMNVRNTGTGKVYGTKLYLTLVSNGKGIGGASFDLGDIDAGKGIKVSTGLVLSKKIPAGFYIAHAEVTGNVGPNNEGITADSDSSFNVFGNAFAGGGNLGAGISKPKHQTVLGAVYPSVQSQTQNLNSWYALLLSLAAYAALRAVRDRKKLKDIFTQNVSFKERVMAIRMFLL